MSHLNAINSKYLSRKQIYSYEEDGTAPQGKHYQKYSQTNAAFDRYMYPGTYCA